MAVDAPLRWKICGDSTQFLLRTDEG